MIAALPEPRQTTSPVEKVAELIAEFEHIRYYSLKDRYAQDRCPGVWTDQGGARTSMTINGKARD
jgi:hypothetical protein